MSTATITTRDGVTTVNLGTSPATPTLEDAPATLRAAIAAVDAATDADSTASATLEHVTRERFAFHAAKFARPVATRDGSTPCEPFDVLPDDYKSAAQRLVWRDATGSDTPVPVKERTAGLKSLGQYLSRCARVATDVTYGGVAVLTDDSEYVEATEAIVDAAKVAKDAKELTLANTAAAEFTEWLDKLAGDKRAALKLVLAIFDGSDSVALTHRAAYVAKLTA